MTGRRDRKSLAKTLTDAYFSQYFSELNSKLMSLSHTPDPGEAWQAHRIAVRSASIEAWFLMPDAPAELIVDLERLVLDDVLGSLGVNATLFNKEMIDASIEALKPGGNLSLTTPYGITLLGSGSAFSAAINAYRSQLNQ